MNLLTYVSHKYLPFLFPKYSVFVATFYNLVTTLCPYYIPASSIRQYLSALSAAKRIKRYKTPYPFPNMFNNYEILQTSQCCISKAATAGVCEALPHPAHSDKPVLRQIPSCSPFVLPDSSYMRLSHKLRLQRK